MQVSANCKKNDASKKQQAADIPFPDTHQIQDNIPIEFHEPVPLSIQEPEL